ncbi:MAG: D-alanyl-D-alanine carboxypeptidase/D-alanyl-D-alanine-endopeptidase [Elusimicrobiaceae bacterium]|nr:D-alanyl-D-alanine carboxypeptidase/D-alanyl-D-alanine-endopeptidase [Elusimicrobiaceae bacterium]
MHKILLSLICLSPLLLAAQPLQDFVLAQQAHPALQGAWWGGLATYADDKNEEIFSIKADTRFAPASTLKLLTTAAALEKLGPDYRFETRLYASALPDENGVLNGNLYVRGGGDMTLGSKRVKGSQPYPQVLKKWVRAIKEAGIQQINGTIYADVSLFEGPTIADKVNWENIGNYFAAPASALCFNDNLFAIHFKGELGHGQRVQVKNTSPEIPGVDIQSFVTADSKNKKDNAYVYAAPDQYNLKIFGTIPTTLTGFTIQAAMPNPALFAVQALAQALTEEAIPVTGQPQVVLETPNYDEMQLLGTHLSPELKDIIFIVNKRSFNLYADMLLRQLAIADGHKGSIKNGLAALNRFLREHNLAAENDTVLYDGSGLSRDNMLTPRVLVNTLVFMMKSSNFGYYYRSLATPNDRGDLLVLRRFLKPSHRVDDVRIKGGTIDGVKALAGYVPDANGRLIAFAFIANNLATNKDESLWRMHENIIKRLLEQKPTAE